MRLPFPGAGGGRKLIMTPEGSVMPTPKPRRDEISVKALVRAHRWRHRIESGRARSITDLAEQEGVTDAYVCRLLPLTCLAPDIVEAILDGRQPKGLRLAEVLWTAAVGGTATEMGASERRRCLTSGISSYPSYMRNLTKVKPFTDLPVANAVAIPGWRRIRRFRRGADRMRAKWRIHGELRLEAFVATKPWGRTLRSTHGAIGFRRRVKADY